MQILQSLQGQFSAFHFFTLFLKVLKISLSFQSSNIMTHIFGPRNGTLLLPWHTDSTSGFFLKLHGVLPFLPENVIRNSW